MKSFFGAMLLGCGILVAGLSGLCVLLLLGSLAFEHNTREQLTYVPAFLLVAGVPLAIGVGMFFIGRSLIRQANSEDVIGPPPTVVPPPAAPPGADKDSQA